MYTIDDLPFDEWLAELANGYGMEEIELSAALVNVPCANNGLDLSFSVFDTVGSN